MLEPNIPLTIDRSKKRKKSIALLISQEHGLVLKVPYRTPQAYIDQLLLSRSAWIQKKWAALTEVLPRPELNWVSGESILYLGVPYTLEISPLPAAKSSCELWEGTLFVRLKKQAQVKQVVERWYRQEAEKLLTARTAYFAERLAVVPQAIIVKQQKRRWGSCDRQNILRYNWQIIKAAPALLDYLVVHELAHIKEKNHSAAFWDLVSTIIPDYKLKRKTLRAFHV